MKNYTGRNSFPWIISINICLKLSNLFTAQDVLQQFYELENTGNVLTDFHLEERRQIPGTPQRPPHAPVCSQRTSVRSHRAGGQASPGGFATRGNIFIYWEDWGIQTLKMEKKEENEGKYENGGENKKKQCFPMSLDKNAVSKMMTFTKRSFDKKVTSFNRCSV